MMKLSAYPTLDGLVDLACRDGVDIRPTLLRVLTDLYVQKPTHSGDEETQYLELALGLIDTVDAPTRAAVTASLSKYPGAPAALLEKLGVAPAAAPPPAKTDDRIEQFFAADPDGRRLIVANLEASPAAPARRPASPSSEVVRRLETAALQHNAGEFGRILERALGVDRALAERIVRDASGEPIVIAAKALGMSAAVVQRVLLFLNPVIGQSVERVHGLARFFDDLAPDAADRMVALWRKTGRTSQPVHQPVHYDDERRGARSLATPSAQRGSRSRDDLASRLKNNG